MSEVLVISSEIPPEVRADIQRSWDVGKAALELSQSPCPGSIAAYGKTIRDKLKLLGYEDSVEGFMRCARELLHPGARPA